MEDEERRGRGGRVGGGVSGDGRAERGVSGGAQRKLWSYSSGLCMQTKQLEKDSRQSKDFQQ